MIAAEVPVTRVADMSIGVVADLIVEEEYGGLRLNTISKSYSGDLQSIMDSHEDLLRMVR